MDDKLKLGEKLVHFFTNSVTRDEAILKLASLLYDCGYVRDTYPSAVIEREKTFPTGLPTEPVGVAIPHTDTEHVVTSAMAIGILANPVTFQEMGSFDAEVKVEVISMLAISDPTKVMPVLKDLAMAYQDHEFLQKLREAVDQTMVLDLITKRIPNVVELI
jgi:PTS system galactitol-specific IIA component